MQTSDVAGKRADAPNGLLDVASVSLQDLVTRPRMGGSPALDGVMRRLFDARDRDKPTVSAFGSAI